MAVVVAVAVAVAVVVAVPNVQEVVKEHAFADFLSTIACK